MAACPFRRKSLRRPDWAPFWDSSGRVAPCRSWQCLREFFQSARQCSPGGEKERVFRYTRLGLTSLSWNSIHAIEKSPFFGSNICGSSSTFIFPSRLGSLNIIDPLSESRDSWISEKWRNASNPMEYFPKLNFREYEIKITSALEIGSGDYKKWKCCYATIDGILFDFDSIQFIFHIFICREIFIFRGDSNGCSTSGS